ncbi:MAG TPA: hypothetical protein VE288_16600 [Rubrobacteraceae bacterium]|nr:hypothetical protein [Rubrobacteraceae bacterium]
MKKQSLMRPESAEEVVGVCWYCGAKLRDGYDYDVVCRECLGEE